MTGQKGFWNEGTRKETHTPREGTIHRGVHPEKRCTQERCSLGGGGVLYLGKELYQESHCT